MIRLRLPVLVGLEPEPEPELDTETPPRLPPETTSYPFLHSDDDDDDDAQRLRAGKAIIQFKLD